MNYIYDIYLNLNNTLYDFFEWNKNDKLIHIKKIPIFKVNEDTFKNIINYEIKMEKEFINDIYNKTELWNIKDKIDYCSLFCDDNNIVAIEFNKSGKSIKKSFLIIDEELEILETSNHFKEKLISFEILKKSNITLKTRKQLREEQFIDNELKNIKNDKLNYIYFECFGKINKPKNRNEILSNIKQISKNSETYKNLYDILKLTSTSKNKMI